MDEFLQDWTALEVAYLKVALGPTRDERLRETLQQCTPAAAEQSIAAVKRKFESRMDAANGVLRMLFFIILYNWILHKFNGII